jgi:hypothetical protein
MRARTRLACAVILSVLLASCGAGGGVVILADPAWGEAAGKAVMGQLEPVGLAHRMTVRLVVSEVALPEAVRRARPRLLLALRLDPDQVQAAAAGLPRTRILTLAAARPGAPGNLVVLRHVPDAGFAEAGRRAGAAGGGCPVGVVSAAADNPATAAFRAGFGEASSLARLRERVVPQAADRAELRRAVDELLADGVRLVVVTSRILAPQVLEVLEARGGHAVVEAQAASGAFRTVVLATVEPDWAAAVEQALSTKGDGPQLVLRGRLVLASGGEAWACLPLAPPAPARASQP